MKNRLVETSKQKEVIELIHALYDSLDYFVQQLLVEGEHEGNFRNDEAKYIISFENEGESTRRLIAKFQTYSVWIDFERKKNIVLCMTNVRGGGGMYPERFEKHYSLIKRSDKNGLTWEGDIDEYLDSGRVLLQKLIRLRQQYKGIGLRKLTVPDYLHYDFWKQANIYQLIYSLAGIILGLTCIIGGVVLFLNGVTGSTNWTAKMLGAENKLTDAAPGVVIFIVGLFIVFVTRYSVKVQNSRRK